MAHIEDTEGQVDSWSQQITNWLHQLVDTVRDRSVRPLLIAIRALIVGVLVAIVSIVVVAMVTIGLFRLFDHTVFPGRVWATDLLFGGIFVLIGVFFFSRIRTSRSSDDDE